MQNSTTSSSTTTSNDEDLKKEMFKGIVDLFTSVSKILIESDFQRTLDNLDSLELKESHGLGIFTKKSYNVGDVAIIDVSKDTYYFGDRFGGELKNLLPSFLSFYTKKKYALTHALAGTRETNPLFPLIGLINHSDNPNCWCNFSFISPDMRSLIGSVHVIKDIKEGEELTINYFPSFVVNGIQLTLLLKVSRHKIIPGGCSEVLKNLLIPEHFSNISTNTNYFELLIYLFNTTANTEFEEVMEKILSYGNPYLTNQSIAFLKEFKQSFKNERLAEYEINVDSYFKKNEINVQAFILLLEKTLREK